MHFFAEVVNVTGRRWRYWLGTDSLALGIAGVTHFPTRPNAVDGDTMTDDACLHQAVHTFDVDDYVIN
jgi:hypothetical protein